MMKGHRIDDVIRWLLSGVVRRSSLVALLTSPLVVFLAYALPFPWDPRFADAGWLGPAALLVAAVLLVLVVGLSVYIKPVCSDGSPPVAVAKLSLPAPVQWQAGISALLFLILLLLLGYEKYGQKSFLIKWPAQVFTPDAVVGGTFRNLKFEKEQLALYVCTEVHDRSGPTTPWIRRCWLDQHPPSLEARNGLWEAICRFGNEDCADMDVQNPKFDLVPLVVPANIRRGALPAILDASASELREQLRDRDFLVGPPFRVQRICTNHALPHFTEIEDALRDLTLGVPPEIHYSVCANAVIHWASAPGAMTTPSYEVYFDGKRVDAGNGTFLAMGHLFGLTGGQPVISEEQWRRGERLELKVSHDPNVQHYRNLYLYWDQACLTTRPSSPHPAPGESR